MKLILRRGELVRVLEDQNLELIDVNNNDIIMATYSKYIKNYPDFVIGNVYDIVVSPHDLCNGRMIYSRKNYDLDYSFVE